MKIKLFALTVFFCIGGYFMFATPAIEEASAWRTTVHLSCSHAPWGNCPKECRDYHACLTTPPAAGCGTERTALCDCLQGLNPNYNCANIPNTVASLIVDSEVQYAGFESFSDFVIASH